MFQIKGSVLIYCYGFLLQLQYMGWSRNECYYSHLCLISHNVCCEKEVHVFTGITHKWSRAIISYTSTLWSQNVCAVRNVCHKILQVMLDYSIFTVTTRKSLVMEVVCQKKLSKLSFKPANKYKPSWIKINIKEALEALSQNSNLMARTFATWRAVNYQILISYFIEQQFVVSSAQLEGSWIYI